MLFIQSNMNHFTVNNFSQMYVLTVHIVLNVQMLLTDNEDTAQVDPISSLLSNIFSLATW